MAQLCEICAGLSPGERPSKGRSKRLRRLLVDGRILSLCDGHAEKVHEVGAETSDELRTLFVEPAGNRSLIDRRSPLDRRAFPARPEGRRKGTGRRGSDAA